MAIRASPTSGFAAVPMKSVSLRCSLLHGSGLDPHQGEKLLGQVTDQAPGHPRDAAAAAAAARRSTATTLP
jgi:hypothetical protein